MDSNKAFVDTKQLERTAKALGANAMEVFFAQSSAEVPALVEKTIAAGSTVACGGSMTLDQCGVTAHLRSGRYEFWDRDAEGVDRDEMMHKAFMADWYLCSANAVTEKGEIYQVDGNANRVAALAYGPRNVLMVVGKNKIVPDIEAAMARRFYIAGPANAKRVGSTAPCTTTGICVDCKSPARICCTELILRQQRVPGRIKLILVNEDLGY